MVEGGVTLDKIRVRVDNGGGIGLSKPIADVETLLRGSGHCGIPKRRRVTYAESVEVCIDAKIIGEFGVDVNFFRRVDAGTKAARCSNANRKLVTLQEDVAAGLHRQRVKQIVVDGRRGKGGRRLHEAVLMFQFPIAAQRSTAGLVN